MEQRVDVREWVEFQWPYLMSWLGGEARVSELAYETGAFSRRREIDSPSKLLQLVLTWAVAGRSLRETAAMAAEAELADVSDVAFMKRFLRAGDWLGSLLASVMDRTAWTGVETRIRLLDATTINRRGSKGTDARLHMSLDLQSHRFDSIELTDASGGEKLERFTFAPGEIVIADRGYAHRSGLAAVMRAGASFIIRFPWSTLPLEHPDGESFDLLGALRSLPEAAPGEFAVTFRSPQGEPLACRLVAIRKSEPAAAAARQRILKEAGKRQRNIDLRTLEAAGYFFVLTNVPPTLEAAKVLALYGLRWQIEMKFKTLKSVLHLGNVPVRNPELLRVYVLAKLLVAVLIDEFITSAESFSPWGYPITTSQLVASH
jgi:hypothetical protein